MAFIYDIMPFTLLDFPGEVACVVWFAGCNMRCVYCHNPEIVFGQNAKPEEELYAFLKKRQGCLSGVVFSGGEATAQPDLPAIVQRVRDLGYKIKLDTNGTRPAVVKDLIDRQLLDYVALDYKAPAGKAEAVTGNKTYWEAFQQTLHLLTEASRSGLGFEIRTTVHSAYLAEEDINAIIQDLSTVGFTGTYYIQNIASTGSKTIGNVPAQSQELDRAKLIKPEGFAISFRNFASTPSR